MNLLLSLVLLADPRASTFDVSGGAVMEMRGGRAPVNPASAPTPSVLAVVAPIGRLHWGARSHATTAVLQYSPRILYRFPNLAQLNRPLLLHQTAAAYSRRLTPTWAMTAQAAADIGELDYTSAQTLFGDQQTALPEADVTSYLSVNGGLVFTGALTPVHSLTIAPNADFRTPYGASTQSSSDPTVDGFQTVLPQQFGTGLTLAHNYLFRPRDTLSLQVSGQYVDFDARGASYIVAGSYGWARRITSRLDSLIRAGLFASQETRPPEGVDRTNAGSPVQPVVVAQLNGRLYNRSGLRISGNFGLSNTALRDSITGEVVPRIGLSSQLTFFFPPRWTAGLSANFYTTATIEPRFAADPGGMTDPDEVFLDPSAQQETALSWRTPVSYSFRNNYAVEFGTIWSVRGPHLSTSPFRFRQLESWLYVAFSVDFASGHIRRRSSGGGGSTVSGGSVN